MRSSVSVEYSPYKEVKEGVYEFNLSFCIRSKLPRRVLGHMIQDMIESVYKKVSDVFFSMEEDGHVSLQSCSSPSDQEVPE